MLREIGLEGEQGPDAPHRVKRGHVLERGIAEVERRLESSDEGVLRPACLDRVSQRVLRRRGALHTPESLAQSIVRLLEMLSDVADRLLRRRRPIVITIRGDSLE